MAIVAVLLFSAYKFATGTVRELLSPYLIEENEVGERSDNMIKKIMEMVEDKLNIHIDYENMIFDYGNEYANKMMDQSREEREFVEETFHIVEEFDETTGDSMEETVEDSGTEPMD